MNVFDHALDVVSQHPGILARQQGLAGLCQTCQDCPVVTSCGGGLYTHRHRSSNGFANPSVYCADLLKLISHIGDRLRAGPPGPADPRARRPAVPGPGRGPGRRRGHGTARRGPAQPAPQPARRGVPAGRHRAGDRSGNQGGAAARLVAADRTRPGAPGGAGRDPPPSRTFAPGPSAASGSSDRPRPGPATPTRAGQARDWPPISGTSVPSLPRPLCTPGPAARSGSRCWMTPCICPRWAVWSSARRLESRTDGFRRRGGRAGSCPARSEPLDAGQYRLDQWRGGPSRC